MGCQKPRKNRHEIIINTSDQKKAFDQIVLWGEAPWWPKQCLMKFTKIGDVSVQKGTMYHQRVNVPFGPRWLSLVTDVVENASISRKYLEGFIDGEETLRLVPSDGTTKIEYVLEYTIRGRFYTVAWKACLEALHDRNIKRILEQLKHYLEQ